MKRLPRLLHFSEKGPRWLLFILFPLFLNLLLYGNLLPAPSLVKQTPLFAFDGPSLLRFLLSLLLVSLVYLALSLLCRRPWIAAALVALPLYVISMVDYYKYYSLGTRIAAEDITMVFSLADIWSPKGAAGNGLFFSPFLLISAPLLLFYIHCLRVYRAGEGIHLPFNRLAGGVLAGWLLLSLSFSSLAYQIFDPQVDAYEAVPSSGQQKGQLSSIDCLIGSLYYDDFTDERATPAKVRQLLAPYQAQPGTGLRPDVIVVMSESYFDLNRVQGLTVPPEIYQNFRRMQRQGSSGRIVVPAFGGGTASTEYEVLSGTSNTSLQGTRSPYDRTQASQHLPTFVDYFQALGYDTSYVHPFKGSFYNRQNAMAAMGFDHILFQEDLTVPLRAYPRDMHVSDETLTDQILAQLRQGDGPHFVWATSMQNHNPYVTLCQTDPQLVRAPAGSLTEGEMDGLNAYAVGIRDTDRALGRLLDYIDQSPRPTALLFFGDHQPLLEGYKKLNQIENTSIYQQLDTLTTDYALYANFPLLEEASDQPFSAFYLMGQALSQLGLPQTRYMAALQDAHQNLPVYSLLLRQEGPDPQQARRCQQMIDILSYDRALGGRFSAGAQDRPQ